jgi:hypothetical protein
MNRSIPVHSAPEMTWTKLSSQRFPIAIVATIAARANATQARLDRLIGAPTGSADALVATLKHDFPAKLSSIPIVAGMDDRSKRLPRCR